MASKPDNRKEYFKKYNKKRERKEYDAEKYQKQKEEEDLAKYREFKRHLEETKIENSWFNHNRNPYLERLSLDGPCEQYNNEKQKRFFLQYDMDNLYTRKRGDTKDYNKKRNKAYNNWVLEKDLFHRIQYYRMFRQEFKKRMNGESPDKTNRMMNDCYLPTELNPESSDFRPELLHLLDEGENSDPLIKVLIPPEWAQKLVDEDSSDSHDSDFNGE